MKSHSSCSLTAAETRIANWVGAQRFANRGRDGLGQGPSVDEYTPALAQRGARAEMATAKILNLYWSPIVIFSDREPDVGGFIEVRSIVEPTHRLIVKPMDKDYPFALTFEEGSNYHFKGWLYASEAKEFPIQEYPNTDRAHYVEQRFLRDIDELFRIIASRPKP